MDGRPAGRLIAAVRRHKQWRQGDLAKAAGVSQNQVSRAERGLISEMTFRAFDAIAGAVGVQVVLEARWLGGTGDRLIDREHAAIVEELATLLRSAGWIVVPEYTFNHFGDRGSVDLLAWHAPSRTLLIIEVKSRLTNLQDLFARLATKVRTVPSLIAKERGWDADHLGTLIVVPGSTANRSVVSQHVSMFASTFPARAVEIRSWLRAPDRSLGGLWYLSPSRSSAQPRPQRVRGRSRAEE